MLLAGEEESAARGLLAAFAWAAADIARMTRASSVLETLTDVLHWHGYAVFGLTVEAEEPLELACDLVRAPVERAARSATRLGSPPRLSGQRAARLVAAAGAHAHPEEEPWEGDLPEAAWVCSEIRVAGERRYFLVIEGGRFTPATIDAIGAFVRLAEVTLSHIAEREAVAAQLVRREAKTRTTIASERLSVLGEAAAVLAHELRNPLATISNGLALLGRPEAADPQLALSIIRDEVARLDSLVQDLLQLARPIDPARRRVELGGLVRNTLERTRRELNGTHVLVPPPATPESVEVMGDPALLSLALENLLRNAAQAAPRDSSIRVVIAPRDLDVTLSVEDDGPGVTRAMQERIFEPFFTTRPVGTGLGLSIVRRLVEAHGGSVKVGSSPSGGARFDLVLSRSR